MELECDLSKINNEELLRKMWQQSEDVSRKKEIRSQLYKLRESRLRDLYQGDIMSDNNAIAGFGKDPLTASHGDALADQSFQSLKSKEIRDSMSPTEMKFQSMALNHPSTTGWNVQSSKEVSPDGQGFRAETVATTDGVESINGGTAEFKGRNEQRSSAHHQGDDKNFVKKAMESSNSHLQEKVVIGDENSGRTEMRTSSTTSTSSSQVFQSSSNVDYDDRAPIEQYPRHHQPYLMDANHQHQQEQQFHQEQQRIQEQQRLQEQQFRQQHQQQVNQQQERRTNTEQLLSSTRQNTEKKNTSQNVETQETLEKNKRYVDMDKASPEYQQHVQYLMQQPGEIIQQNVEYPKPNVKMITTVKRLPDGTIVRNKRYETEELTPTTPSTTRQTTTSTNQTNQRRDSQQQTPSGRQPGRRPTEDMVDNVETNRYVQNTHNDDVETKFSSVKQSSRKFSTETTSETIQDSTNHENPRIKAVTNDFSTHGFPSVKSHTPTQEFASDRPQGSRPTQGFPSQPLTVPQDAIIPHYVGDNQNITERRIPTKDGELIIVSSEKKRNYKTSTNSERIIETEHNVRDDQQHYQPISDNSQDFTTHGFPSVREPQAKNYPEQRQMQPQDFPLAKIPPGTRIITHTTSSPHEDAVVVSSQKSHTTKHSSNTERVIEHEVIRDDQGYPRIKPNTENTIYYTVTTPGDQGPRGGFPGTPGKSTQQDYSTQGFPSARSPTRTSTPTQGYPNNRDGTRPNGTNNEYPRSSPTKTQPRATSPNKFRTPNTTRDTTERVIRKEKETDSAHRAFAASLRSSSPVDSPRRDSFTTDSHTRHTPRSSISSTKTFRREGREGSHDSAPSETSRISNTTVTRQTPPRTVGGKTTVTRVVTTKTAPGSNETLNVTSPRATKSPSPGKTVTTTTTTKTITSKSPAVTSTTVTTTKDVPKTTDNQHTRKLTSSTTTTTNTTNKPDSIFPINEPLINTKISFSDNQNMQKKHQTTNNSVKSPISPLGVEIIEEPCLKKQFYLLGPSDQPITTKPPPPPTPNPYKNSLKYEKSPIKQSSPQPSAPNSRTSPTPSYKTRKPLTADVDDDQPEKSYTTTTTIQTTQSSPLSPSRSRTPQKPIGPYDKPKEETIPHKPDNDERRTVNRETTFEKIETLPDDKNDKPSYQQPNVEWIVVDDVDITKDEDDDDDFDYEDVDATLNIKKTTKQLITHEKDTPQVPNRRPKPLTNKTNEIRKPQGPTRPVIGSPTKLTPNKQFTEPRTPTQTRPQKSIPDTKTPMNLSSKTQPRTVDTKQQPKVPSRVVPKSPNRETLPACNPIQRKSVTKVTTDDQTVRKTSKTDILKERFTKVVDDKKFPLKDTPKRRVASPENKPSQRSPVYKKPQETTENETVTITETSKTQFPVIPKRRSQSPENKPHQRTPALKEPYETNEDETVTITETSHTRFPVIPNRRSQSPEQKPQQRSPNYKKPQETNEDETITITETSYTRFPVVPKRRSQSPENKPKQPSPVYKKPQDINETTIITETSQTRYPETPKRRTQSPENKPTTIVTETSQTRFPETPKRRTQSPENKPIVGKPGISSPKKSDKQQTTIITETSQTTSYPETPKRRTQSPDNKPIDRRPGQPNKQETITTVNTSRIITEKQTQELEQDFITEPNYPDHKAPKYVDSQKPQQGPKSPTKEFPLTPKKDVSPKPTPNQRRPKDNVIIEDQTFRKTLRTTDVVKEKTIQLLDDERFPEEDKPNKKGPITETRPNQKPTEPETYTQTREFVTKTSQNRVVSEEQIHEFEEPNYPGNKTPKYVDSQKPQKGPQPSRKDTSPKSLTNQRKPQPNLPVDNELFRKTLEITKKTATMLDDEEFPNEESPYKKSPKDGKPGVQKPTDDTDEDETFSETSEFVIKSSQKRIVSEKHTQELEEDFTSEPIYPDNKTPKSVDSQKPQKGPRYPNKDVSPTRSQKKPVEKLPVDDQTFRKTLRTSEILKEKTTTTIDDEEFPEEDLPYNKGRRPEDKPKERSPGLRKPTDTDDDETFMETSETIVKSSQKRIVSEKQIYELEEDNVIENKYPDNKTPKYVESKKPEKSYPNDKSPTRTQRKPDQKDVSPTRSQKKPNQKDVSPTPSQKKPDQKQPVDDQTFRKTLRTTEVVTEKTTKTINDKDKPEEKSPYKNRPKPESTPKDRKPSGVNPTETDEDETFTETTEFTINSTQKHVRSEKQFEDTKEEESNYPENKATKPKKVPKEGSPTRGPSSPTREPSSPTRGPSSPTRGPSSPTRGPSSPTRGPSSPTRGQSSPTRGPSSPTRGTSSPTRGTSSPTRGPSSPTRGPHKNLAVDDQVFRKTLRTTDKTTKIIEEENKPKSGKVEPVESDDDGTTTETDEFIIETCGKHIVTKKNINTTDEDTFTEISKFTNYPADKTPRDGNKPLEPKKVSNYPADKIPRDAIPTLKPNEKKPENPQFTTTYEETIETVTGQTYPKDNDKFPQTPKTHKSDTFKTTAETIIQEALKPLTEKPGKPKTTTTYKETSPIRDNKPEKPKSIPSYRDTSPVNDEQWLPKKTPTRTININEQFIETESTRTETPDGAFISKTTQPSAPLSPTFKKKGAGRHDTFEDRCREILGMETYGDTPGTFKKQPNNEVPEIVKELTKETTNNKEDFKSTTVFQVKIEDCGDDDEDDEPMSINSVKKTLHKQINITEQTRNEPIKEEPKEKLAESPTPKQEPKEKPVKPLEPRETPLKPFEAPLQPFETQGKPVKEPRKNEPKGKSKEPLESKRQPFTSDDYTEDDETVETITETTYVTKKPKAQSPEPIVKPRQKGSKPIEPKGKSKEPLETKKQPFTSDDYTEDDETVETITQTTYVTKKPKAQSPEPKLKPRNVDEIVETTTKTTVSKKSPKSKPLDDTDDTSEQETYISSRNINDTLEQIEIINREMKKTEVKIIKSTSPTLSPRSKSPLKETSSPRSLSPTKESPMAPLKQTSSPRTKSPLKESSSPVRKSPLKEAPTSPRSQSPTKDTKTLASPKSKPSKESFDSKPTKTTPKKSTPNPDTDFKTTTTIKDRLRSSTRKTKSPSKQDQVDGSESSPDESPTRVPTERRRSSNISVNTEIIIEHTEVESHGKKEKSPGPKRPQNSVFREIIDSTVLPDKLPRKMLVTERKESAPVHRVTNKDKDSKMSRSTSENLIKVSNTLSPKTTPKTTDHRRPNKCFATKSINLTTTDRLVNSHDMESVIIDIQHAKSSREPSPDKIVPTPVPAHLDTGKPRYPDVVQEPEDEHPRKKPQVKNIPIFEEEHNTYVGCHITEVNVEKTRKTTMDSLDCDQEILNNPVIEAPPSLDYPSLDKPNDDECLLTVHEKVSKFQHIAEEVKKPKASGPFNREFDDTCKVPEDDECLLTIDEKVDKFLKTAENITKPITPVRETKGPFYEDERDEDEEFVQNERIYSSIKLAPTVPQKSPDLVRNISRHISRQSDNEASEVAHNDDEATNEDFVECLINNKQQKTTKEFIMTHRERSPTEKYQQIPIKRNNDHDDVYYDDDDELIPHTATHTTILEERRQKDILTRPSVFADKTTNNKKPNATATTTTTTKTPFKYTIKSPVKDSEKLRPDIKSRTKPAITTSVAEHKTEHTNKTSGTTTTATTTINKRKQSPQRKHSTDIDYELRDVVSGSNNIETGVGIISKQTKVYNNSNTTSSTAANDLKKFPTHLVNKKPEKYIPVSFKPAKNLDEHDLNTAEQEEEILINIETTTTKNLSNINDTTTVVTGKANKESLYSKTPLTPSQTKTKPHSSTHTSSTPLRSKPKEHVTTRINERSTLKHNLDYSTTTTSSKSKNIETTEEDYEIVEPVLEATLKKSPHTPKTTTTKTSTMDTVAARRSLFENNHGPTTPTKRTPIASPLPGRRPSYMDHTKASLEHTRRDSLEINKTNYSRKPSHPEDDITAQDRNTTVKFNVPQTKLNQMETTMVTEDINIEEIYDLEILERMLETVTSYELRRRIRAQIRLIKKNQKNELISTEITTKTTKTISKPSSKEEPDTTVRKTKPVSNVRERSVSPTSRTTKQFLHKESESGYHYKNEVNRSNQQSPMRPKSSPSSSPDRERYHHEDSEYIRTRSPESRKKPDRSPSSQETPVCVRNAKHNRSHSPETTETVREYGSHTTMRKQYYYKNEEQEEIDEITQETRRESSGSPTRLTTRKTSTPRKFSPQISLSPDRRDSSPETKKPTAKTTERSRSPQAKPVSTRVGSRSPTGKTSSLQKTSATYEQSLKSSSSTTNKQQKRLPLTNKTKPEDKSSTPIWADRKNLLKTPSSTTPTTPKKPLTSSTLDSRSGFTKTTKSSTSQKMTTSSSSNKSTFVEDDCITSSYGIGPTDENGLPLFGIRALKKKKQPTTEPCETTEEVTGYVVEEKYYSDNKTKPIVERKELIYSTNPEELERVKEQVKGSTTIKSLKDTDVKETRQTALISKTNAKATPALRSSPEDDFLDSTTKYVRRGSVKEMSEKFIHRESSSSLTEKSNYPKAGLILRTNSRKNSRDNDTDGENYDSYKSTRVQHITSVLGDSDDAEHEYDVEESGSHHSGRLITESESECESIKTQREFKKVTSSSTSSSSRSFLNSQGDEKVITNVTDCLERMRNADNVIEEGDTAEDQEARALLNKFLGASIIMKGVETSLPPASNRQSKIITTTTTNNNRSEPAKHEVKTTRITKTIKSGSSSSPVTQTTCDIEEIWDEEILKELLEQARTYEERRKIRSRLRELMADREEKNKSQAGEKEVKPSTETTTTSNVQEEDSSSASEYEEIIEEVTDYSESEAETDDKKSENKEVETTKQTEIKEEVKENPKETKSAKSETKPDTSEASSSDEETVKEDVSKQEVETKNVKEVELKTETKTKTVEEVKEVEDVKDVKEVEDVKEVDEVKSETKKVNDNDKTDSSAKGESLMPLLQDILHQTVSQGGTSQQQSKTTTNSQKLKSVQSSNNNSKTTGGIKSKTSSENSSMHVPYNKTSSTAPKTSQKNPIVTVQTAGRVDSSSISNSSNNNNSSSNSNSIISSNSVAVGNNSPRQVDRLGVPQKEDSGTESGEDLRLIAAGLRDQLQIQSDSNIIEDVTCALSRLENSLKEGKDITVDTEKRKALLALVARLQAGLTSPEKLAEIAAAMSELDGNEGLYGETSSPEADAHRSNRSRFAKRRTRINRHTVGVSREELADARRYMEDMMMMSNNNISQSTTPEANNSNNTSPPQWYPLEKNASTGAILKPPSPSILQRPKQFVPEAITPNLPKSNNKLSVNNGNKRRPLSGEYSVSFQPQVSYKEDESTKIELNEVNQNRVKQDSPPDDGSKFARFSNKKHLMKRANTIDIAKTQKYISEFDTDSDAEDKGPYLGLKRTVQVSVKKRVQTVVPPFEPKTENDRKFLAFINKQSDKPGLGWTTSRSVSNWSNKFGSIKNTFEGGLVSKPPQIPHHVAPTKPYQANKLFSHQVTNNSATPYVTTNQQIAQRLQQEAERQAEERRRKLERERLEYERREREKLERQRQQRERQERERLEREYFERQRREQDQIAAAQHAAILREQEQLAKAQQQAAMNVNAPQPMPINEFKHAPQSVFRPIDNGETYAKPIYKPIPQLPMNSNNWQNLTSQPRAVSSNNLTPTSPGQYGGNTRPDNSFITSPTPSSRSPIGLPWASRPTVDSSSFKSKANRFEERSKYDNVGNGGPFLQRHNSLRSANGNNQQNEEFRKRPSLPNTCDPYSVNKLAQLPDPLAYLPPPQNISFTYNDLKPKVTYQSYPCLPTAVVDNVREPDYHRSREDSLTDPHSVPLVLTSSNPSYCPPQQQTLAQPRLPRQFDIVSPLDSAPTSPSIMLQTDCTDDDVDSDNLLEYHAVSRVMAKPQSQTAVTVGRRTGHASDDELYGKNSRAARNLLSTMKNLGNPNGDRKQRPTMLKRSEQVTSPKLCLSPDGRSYQAPLVEPLFPDVTNFEANRQPLYVGQTKKQQAPPTFKPKSEYETKPRTQLNMYKSLENLNRQPHANHNNYVPPMQIPPQQLQPAPLPAKPYASENQSSYVVTYPIEDTTDDEDYSRHSQKKMMPPKTLDLRRQRNISENSTGSSTTASMSYSQNLPSPNTSWTANPIMSDDFSNYQNVGGQYQTQPRVQPQASVKGLNQTLSEEAYTYQRQNQGKMPTQNQFGQASQLPTDYLRTPTYEAQVQVQGTTMAAQQPSMPGYEAQSQRPLPTQQHSMPAYEAQVQMQGTTMAAQQPSMPAYEAQSQRSLPTQQHTQPSSLPSYEAPSQRQLPTMGIQQQQYQPISQIPLTQNSPYDSPSQRQLPTMPVQHQPVAQTQPLLQTQIPTSPHEIQPSGPLPTMGAPQPAATPIQKTPTQKKIPTSPQPKKQQHQTPPIQAPSKQKKAYEAQPQRELQTLASQQQQTAQSHQVVTQKQTSNKSTYEAQSQRKFTSMSTQQQTRTQKPPITQKPTDYPKPIQQTKQISQTTTSTTTTANKKSLASMRKSVSEDHHTDREQTVINPQNSNISQEMITKLDQQRERVNNEIRRKSLGNALDYQMEKQARYETHESEIYKSSAPSDTPDIVKSSLPKDDNQPILKKFGPPQRHHYIPNAYQSPGTNVTKSSAVSATQSTTIHSKNMEISANKTILKTSHQQQQHLLTNTRPAVVETPATPQPDDDYIPRNIVFNNVHAFTSMSRRPDDDGTAMQDVPQMRPNKLSKSDSWNQIIQLQNQQLPPPSPKFNQSPTNELRRTKSGHTLTLPKMYEAAMAKADISEKQKTVAAYFSGQKSPTQQEMMVEQHTKRSVINRTKTSEKISASRKSLGSNLPIAPGGLTRSATMPHIANLNFLDESNVEDAFEQLMMDEKQPKTSSSTTEKTETKEKDGAVVTTTTKVTTRTVSGSAPKPVSPFAKFKQLDRQNSQQSAKSPTTPTTPGGGSTASPSSTGNQPIFKFTDPALNARAATVKDQLLQWCQMKTQEYENIEITNFSTSWNNGLAFCALIHHFLPDAFDYSQLTPKQRRKNFELAFTVADEKAGIAPLLDVEDMVVMQRPDWKCVFVYVQSIYRRFRNCQ